MASTYPSTQWSTVKRGEIPCFAASDIVLGAPVKLVNSGDWAVVMCQSGADKPIGTARDNAAVGDAVSVYDDGNILRINTAGMGAGASFSRQSYVGVIGTSSAVHPITGVSVNFPVLGGVSASSGIGVGASGAANWAVGVAFESAAVGDQAAYRVEPRLLSGLLTN